MNENCPNIGIVFKCLKKVEQGENKLFIPRHCSKYQENESESEMK
jgi:hypothetical protein